jgi:hypothetical protein
MSSQAFFRITGGRVQEAVVWEQLVYKNLKLFNPTAQEYYQDEFLQQSTPNQKHQTQKTVVDRSKHRRDMHLSVKLLLQSKVSTAGTKISFHALCFWQQTGNSKSTRSVGVGELDAHRRNKQKRIQEGSQSCPQQASEKINLGPVILPRGRRNKKH